MRIVQKYLFSRMLSIAVDHNGIFLKDQADQRMAKSLSSFFLSIYEIKSTYKLYWVYFSPKLVRWLVKLGRNLQESDRRPEKWYWDFFNHSDISCNLFLPSFFFFTQRANAHEHIFSCDVVINSKPKEMYTLNRQQFFYTKVIKIDHVANLRQSLSVRRRKWTSGVRVCWRYFSKFVRLII